MKIMALSMSKKAIENSQHPGEENQRKYAERRSMKWRIREE
jgi:hypothetical protein